MTELVVLTQATESSESLACRLEAAGLQVARWPLVELQPVAAETIGPVLARLADFDWIFLPSPSAVRLVAQRMKEMGIAWPAQARAGLVGPASVEAFRECFGDGPVVDAPARPPYDAAHLVEMVGGQASPSGAVPPIRALVLNRPDGRTHWMQGLRHRTQSVEVVAAYAAWPLKEGPPADLKGLLQRLHRNGGAVSWVIGSASQVDTLLQVLPAEWVDWAKRQKLLVPHPAVLTHAQACGFENASVYEGRRDLVERLQCPGNGHDRALAEPADSDADKEEVSALSLDQEKEPAPAGAGPAVGAGTAADGSGRDKPAAAVEGPAASTPVPAATAVTPAASTPAAATPAAVATHATGSSPAGSSTGSSSAATPSAASRGSSTTAAAGPASAPRSSATAPATGPSPASSTSTASAASRQPLGDLPPRKAEPPPPAPPSPPAGHGRRGGGLWALLLLLLLALLAGGGWWYTQQRFLAAERDSARRTQEAEGRAAKLEEQVRTLRDAQNQLLSRSSRLEAKIAESSAQQEQMTSLYDEIARARGEGALAEVEQSVLMASQHLELTGNVQAALLALQNAERRLGSSDQSQAIGARRLIVQDIERLKALPEIDMTRLAARLDEIINRIDRLPMMADATEAPPAQDAPGKESSGKETAPAPAASPAPTAAPAASTSAPSRPAGSETASSPPADDQSRWQRLYASILQNGARGLDAVKDEFRNLVTIRRIDQPDNLLLSPEQKQSARENLKLLLLNARLNLLNRHEDLLRQDLARAMEAMKRLYDPEQQDVKTALATLESLQAQPLALNLPSLAESLGAVRAARAAGEKRS